MICRVRREVRVQTDNDKTKCYKVLDACGMLV
jgi:hypothetical protein